MSVESRAELDALVVVAHGADVSVNGNLLRWRHLLEPNIECIVVDNTPHGATAGLNHELAAAAGVRVVSFPDNPGYLGAVLRIEQAIVGPPQNFVVITNADIEPIAIQSSVFRGVSADVGVIGPLHGLASRHRQVDDVSVLKLVALIARDALSWVFGVPASRFAADSISDVQALDPALMVHGSCFALRRNLLLDLKEVRPRPFLYGEELLLGWMLARRSQRHFVPSTGFEVQHRLALKTGESSGRWRYQHRVKANLALLYHRITRFRRL